MMIIDQVRERTDRYDRRAERIHDGALPEPLEYRRAEYDLDQAVIKEMEQMRAALIKAQIFVRHAIDTKNTFAAGEALWAEFSRVLNPNI